MSVTCVCAAPTPCPRGGGRGPGFAGPARGAPGWGTARSRRAPPDPIGLAAGGLRVSPGTPRPAGPCHVRAKRLAGTSTCICARLRRGRGQQQPRPPRLGGRTGPPGRGFPPPPWGSRCPATLACEDTSSLPPPGLWLLDPATLSPNSRTSGLVPLKQRLPPRVSVSRRCGAAVTGAEPRGDSFLRETPALCPLPAFPDTCYESGVYLHVSVWE